MNRLSYSLFSSLTRDLSRISWQAQDSAIFISSSIKYLRNTKEIRLCTGLNLVSLFNISYYCVAHSRLLSSELRFDYVDLLHSSVELTELVSFNSTYAGFP